MRKLLSLLIVSLFFVSGFAYDGLMSGEKNLKVIQTKWFDIVYPEGSERSALVLYENVDNVYEEVGQMYGFPPQFRMPVVITSSVQNFNAYWSPFPYNHIAVYDTFAIDDLDVFSENLVSTFRHEVIHAFSYNSKNKFWKALSFFGDILNPGYLFITQGWAEGATVSGESVFGEGRLNNEFILQMIKQAKIENQFPRYRDVQGASDKYPINTFYYFNGAFNQWLQQTYGMEKYAAFWYKCVNFQTISTHLAFKKIYGIALEQAWTQFKDDIYIPDVSANPIDSGLVKDFFENSRTDYSIRNNAGSLYSSLTMSEKGLAYLDQKNGTVYYVPKKSFTAKKNKAVKLFAKSGIENISFSKDGRYLAVGWYSDVKATSIQKSSVYDLEQKKFIYELSSTANPAIIQKNNDYFLVAQNYKNQKYSICIKQFAGSTDTTDMAEVPELTGSAGSTSLPYEKMIDLPVFENGRTFVQLGTEFGEGSFACITKNGAVQSITVYSLNGELIQEFNIPDKIYIRYLSYDSYENSLIFSYVEKGSLPRLGSLNLLTGKYYLQKADVSGGVVYPVAVDSGTIVFAGKFFRQNRLFFGDKDVLLENREKFIKIESKNGSNRASTVDFDDARQVLEENGAKKYNPFKFYAKGVILPVSLVTSKSYANSSNQSYLLPFGATYISSNPWSNGIFIASAGYGLTTNSWGANLAYQSSSDTSLYNYSMEGMVEFDTNGWKQVNGTVQGGLNIPFGNVSVFRISDSAAVFAGRGNRQLDLFSLFNYYPGIAADTSMTTWLSIRNTLSAGYSNIRKVGPGKYEKGGFSVTASFVLGDLFKVPEVGSRNPVANLGVNFTAYIPKLIPVLCYDRFTYNLPLRLSFDLLPYGTSSGIPITRPASFPSFFGINGETILFGYDLQKAVPVLTAIFVNNMQLSFVYYGAMILNSNYSTKEWNFIRIPSIAQDAFTGQFIYSQWTGLKLSVGLTPNFGALSNRTFKMDYFIECGFNTEFSVNQAAKVTPGLTFGYSTNF